MPSLSLIDSEARRLLKSLVEPRRSEMQQALVALCEEHWREMRGAEPASPPDSILAQLLWSVTPLWGDLFTDLYLDSDPRLLTILPLDHLAGGMALILLAEIERGNEAGVQMSYEAMMVFEMDAPPMAWLERVSSLLRGTLEPPMLHLHSHKSSLYKALALIAQHTRRLDLSAVLGVIELLIESTESVNDEALETLRQVVLEAGIRFLRIEDDYLQLELHGHEHKPVRSRELGEILLEIRQAWLK